VVLCVLARLELQPRGASSVVSSDLGHMPLSSTASSAIRSPYGRRCELVITATWRSTVDLKARASLRTVSQPQSTPRFTWSVLDLAEWAAFYSKRCYPPMAGKHSDIARALLTTRSVCQLRRRTLNSLAGWGLGERGRICACLVDVFTSSIIIQDSWCFTNTMHDGLGETLARLVNARIPSYSSAWRGFHPRDPTLALTHGCEQPLPDNRQY
jgi:hypothetical protein